MADHHTEFDSDGDDDTPLDPAELVERLEKIQTDILSSVRSMVDVAQENMAATFSAPLEALHTDLAKQFSAPLEAAQSDFASQFSQVAEAALADFQERMAASVRPDTEIVEKMLDVARGEITEAARSVATSVRLPRALHDVASQVVDAGWASSMTDLVSTGLRTGLALLATSAVDLHSLDEVRDALASHYKKYPEAEPTLALIVEAAAKLEDHPAAEHPDLIQAATEDLGEGAYVEDVLAWVKGALHSGRTAKAS